MRQRQCRGHRCVMEKWVLECANKTLEGKRTKGAKDKSAKHNKMTMHKIHRSRCASTGVGRTLYRYQEDWCGFNALQVWVCLSRSRRRQFQHNNVVWDSTAAKTTFNSLQAQPCFNPSGSRLLTVHVDRDLQHWFWCFSSRSMHEQADLYYNVLGRLSISDSA